MHLPTAMPAAPSARTTAVLFIQGAGKGAHSEDRVLADALQQALGERFLVVFPPLPNEADPDTDVWKHAIAEEARRARAAVLVAHSAGAANVADLLAEGRYRTDLPPLRGLFLLAPPFIGPGGWEFEGFHFDAPVAAASLGGLPVHFYFGSADATVPAAHADLYRRVFPDARLRILPGCDHQFTGQLPIVARDVRAVIDPDA